MNVQYIFYGLLGALLLLSQSNSAQSLGRQTLSSASGSNAVNGVYLTQTVGQPYHTATSHSNGLYYRPGFQQPGTANGKIPLGNTLNLKLFPNPAVNAFTINSATPIANAVIQVNDIEGKLMFNEHVANLSVYTINCSNWLSGSYMITVYDEMVLTRSSKQIIVSH